MTTIGKVLAVTVGIGAVIGATLALRPHPAPAAQRAILTPSQLAEIKPAVAPRPVAPSKVLVVAPPREEGDDVEDGNGS